MNRRLKMAHRKELVGIAVELAAARPCGPCTECCTALQVDAKNKPAGVTCRNLRPERAPTACAVYQARPRECREFFCGWRLGLMGEQDRPDMIGVVLRPGKTGDVRWLLAMESRTGALVEQREAITNLAFELDQPILLKRPDESMNEPIGPMDALLELAMQHGAVQTEARRFMSDAASIADMDT